MELDSAATRAFLELLYGDVGEGWFTLMSKRLDDSPVEIDWVLANDLDEVVRVAAQRAPQGHVWFGVALRREPLGRRRGGAQDCLSVPGLWLDVDIEGPGHKTPDPLPLDVDDALSLLAEHPVPPSVVVHSGGGLQPYWLFDTPRPAAEMAPALGGWHRLWAQRADDRGWALDAVSDLARVMRLPGSFNWKTGEPQPVTLINT